MNIVVTGGSSGIGKACIMKFLASEDQVFNLDINPIEGVSSDNLVHIETNLSKSTSIQEAFKKIDVNVKTIDALVYSAGIQHYGTVASTSEEDWDKVMNVNLKGAFLCAQESIARMDKGAIINIASVQSLLSQANVCPYTTSKSALLGLTRSIAIDFAPNIRSVAICPGSVDTPMLRDSAAKSGDEEAFFKTLDKMHLSGRIAQPEEIANLVDFLCRDSGSFINGQAIRIDGGLGISLGGSVD